MNIDLVLLLWGASIIMLLVAGFFILRQAFKDIGCDNCRHKEWCDENPEKDCIGWQKSRTKK